MAIRRWQSTASTDLSAVGNWTDGDTPDDGDTIIFDGSITGLVKPISGFAYFTSLANVTIHFTAGWTLGAGLAPTGTSGATYLTIGDPSINGTYAAHIGFSDQTDGSGNGSSDLFLAFNTAATNATTLYLNKTGPKTTGAYPPCCLKGGNVTIHQFGGDAGFAVFPGDVGLLTSLRQSKGGDGTGGKPVMRVGNATNSAAVVDYGSVVYAGTLATLPSIKITGPDGEVTTRADTTAAVTAVESTDGKFISNGTGTITGATMRGSATFDLSGNSAARTVTNCIIDKGCTVNMDNGVAGSITWTNGIKCTGGIGENGAKIITPPVVTVTPAAY